MAETKSHKENSKMKRMTYFLMALLMACMFYGRAIAADGVDIYNDGVNRVKDDGQNILYAQVYRTATTGTTVDMKYSLITNAACTAASHWDLPASVEVGSEITFYLERGFDMDIDPYSTDTIYYVTDTAGDTLSSDAATGSSVTLRKITSTRWIALQRQGTWSDLN